MSWLPLARFPSSIFQPRRSLFQVCPARATLLACSTTPCQSLSPMSLHCHCHWLFLYLHCHCLSLFASIGSLCLHCLHCLFATPSLCLFLSPFVSLRLSHLHYVIPLLSFPSLSSASLPPPRPPPPPLTPRLLLPPPLSTPLATSARRHPSAAHLPNVQPID